MRTPNNSSKRAATGANNTVAPVTTRTETGGPEPEFVRVEPATKMFGPCRGWFYKGIRKGWFKSVLLRQAGAKNGIRLLHVASVREFINTQVSAGIDAERSEHGATLRKAALRERQTTIANIS